jgi:hypothetical protein
MCPERKMRKLIASVSAAALFGFAQGAAQAQDRACKFAEWGCGYYRIEQQGEPWTYVLTASGPNWKTIPYGYHAPGGLVCESCSSSSIKQWGLYYFGDQADLRPATAAERAEQPKEWVGYPYTPLGPHDLEHYGSREGITLGPLTGYAVQYRIVPKEHGEKIAWDGVLAIELTDGCVSFGTTILLQLSGGGDPWTALDSLLREVTITKSPGSHAGPPHPGGAYSAVVKARRKNE